MKFAKALGCAFLIVIGVSSCAGVLFWSYRSLDTDITPVIEELFAAIADGKFGDTYDTHTTSELRGVVSREKYEELGQAIQTRLGSLRSKTLRGFRMHTNNATTTANVTYEATFERAKGAIRANLRKDGDRWLLLAFNVDSPEFQKDFATKRCPHCDAAHTESAKFCPECGKPLAADAEPAESADAQPADTETPAASPTEDGGAETQTESESPDGSESSSSSTDDGSEA